jgi:hypothetical protein
MGKSKLTEADGKKAWAYEVLRKGKSKLTETDKGESGEEQIQELAHHMIWHKLDWRMASSGMLRRVVLKRSTRRNIPESAILESSCFWAHISGRESEKLLGL